MSKRTLFASAVLVMMAVGAAEAQVCDDRYPWTCAQAAPVAAETTEAVKSAAPDAQAKRATTTRAARSERRRAVRKRTEQRRRQAQSPDSDSAKDSKSEKSKSVSSSETTASTLTEPVPTPPENPARSKDQVPVASQEDVNEIDLSADRLLITPLSSATASDVSAKPDILSGTAASALPSIPVQTTTILRKPPASEGPYLPASSAQAAQSAHSPASPAADSSTEEVSAAPDSPDSSDTSWLRRIFIGLGGVLAVASAIRMFIG